MHFSEEEEGEPQHSRKPGPKKPRLSRSVYNVEDPVQHQILTEAGEAIRGITTFNRPFIEGDELQILCEEEYEVVLRRMGLPVS